MSGVWGSEGDAALRKLGTGEPGGCGVDGHAGAESLEANGFAVGSSKPAFEEVLRGSYMMNKVRALATLMTARTCAADPLCNSSPVKQQ